jgi:hypothetical protein
MKTFKTLAALLILTGLLFNNSSCVVVKKDNGKHKGWFKNRNNPHHPNTTNPGKAKGRSKNR